MYRQSVEGSLRLKKYQEETALFLQAQEAYQEMLKHLRREWHDSCIARNKFRSDMKRHDSCKRYKA